MLYAHVEIRKPGIIDPNNYSGLQEAGNTLKQGVSDSGRSEDTILKRKVCRKQMKRHPYGSSSIFSFSAR